MDEGSLPLLVPASQIEEGRPFADSQEVFVGFDKIVVPVFVGSFPSSCLLPDCLSCTYFATKFRAFQHPHFDRLNPISHLLRDPRIANHLESPQHFWLFLFFSFRLLSQYFYFDF